MAKIKVAVIGVGFLGERHARIYSELPDVELVGVVDVDHGRAESIAAMYRCAAFSDIFPLIGLIDAASVVVPTASHYQIARTLLHAGVDILLEKPMTATLAEADDLIALAEGKGKTLQVGHVERFNAGVRKLKENIALARFIECHRMGPFVERGTDVDVVLDLMIHDIDIILSLTQSPIVEVRAVGVPVLSTQIDIANARLKFLDGCVANITASRISSERLRKIRIFQPDTYLSLDYREQELTISRREIRPGVAAPKVAVQKIEIKKGEPLREEISSFVQAVGTRHSPGVSGREGRAALAVALEIAELMKG